MQLPFLSKFFQKMKYIKKLGVFPKFWEGQALGNVIFSLLGGSIFASGRGTRFWGVSLSDSPLPVPPPCPCVLRPESSPVSLSLLGIRQCIFNVAVKEHSKSHARVMLWYHCTKKFADWSIWPRTIIIIINNREGTHGFIYLCKAFILLHHQKPGG